MKGDKGQWQGMPEGWHRPIRTQDPQDPVNGINHSYGSSSGDSSGLGGNSTPNGTLVQLPENTWIPVTGQNLCPQNNVAVPAGTTVTILTFQIPLLYNGWIQTLVMNSANNFAALQAGTPALTSLNPTLNGQRIWPFLGLPDPTNPNLSYTIYPGFPLTEITIPLQVRDSNIIMFQATNMGGAADIVNVGITGFMDRGHQPNPSASKQG